MPWPLVQQTPGQHDFSLIDDLLAAQRRHKALPIWDLCHYGFPAVDMTDWHSGNWLHLGIADVEEIGNGTLMRKPFLPYVQMLHRWQTRLGQPTSLDADPYDAPVRLQDVVGAARALDLAPDADWH